jgi:hypothetical protein
MMNLQAKEVLILQILHVIFGCKRNERKNMFISLIQFSIYLAHELKCLLYVLLRFLLLALQWGSAHYTELIFITWYDLGTVMDIIFTFSYRYMYAIILIILIPNTLLLLSHPPVHSISVSAFMSIFIAGFHI